MTCMEVQQKIVPFINNEMTLEQAEIFLDHIRNCADCREELEVTYTLLTAMKQLDEDRELSNNYKQDLDRKIAEVEERIRKEKTSKLRKRFLLFSFIFAFALVSSLQLGELALEMETEYVPAKTHSFLLKLPDLPIRYNHTLNFIEQKHTKAKRYVQQMQKKRLKMRIDLEKERIKWMRDSLTINSKDSPLR